MPSETPFVGRRPELAKLRGAFRGAARGQGCVVLISGELGIGKTRLLDRFAADVAAESVLVAQGRWYEAAEAPTFVGFSECLWQLLQDQRVLTRMDRSSPYLSDVARLGPEFATALKVQASPSSDAALDAPYRLRRGVALVLRAAAAVGPTILTLDDLQWADAGSASLIGFLGHETRSVPVLILGAYRDDEVTEGHPILHATADLVRAGALETITLRGLDKEEVEALAIGLTRQDVAPEFVETLYSQTRGNPLFVVEQVRHLLAVAAERSGYGNGGAVPASALEVAQSLHVLLGRRLSRLSPPCRRLLDVAAVIGRDVDLPLLQAACNLRPKAFFRALDEAVAARAFIESSAGLCGFSHPLMRTIVYEQIPASRRMALHFRVAEALKSRAAGEHERHVREISRHLMASGGLARPDQVADWCLRGARQARRIFDHSESRELLVAALHSLDQASNVDPRVRAEALVELGYAETGLGHIDEGVTRYREALAIASSLDDRGLVTEVRRWLAAALLQYGRAGEALTVTADGLAQTPPLASHAYVSLVAAHVLAAVMNGAPAAAEPWIQTLLRLADHGEVESDETKAVANHAAGVWYAWCADEWDEASTCFRRSWTLLKNEGVDATAGEVACEHAATAYFLGRFHEAEEAVRESEALAAATRRTSTLADIHGLRGLMYLHRGAWRRARRERRAWKALTSGYGGTPLAAFVRRAEALERLWREGPRAAASAFDWNLPLSEPMRAFLYAEEGDRARATALVEALSAQVPRRGEGLLWLAAALPLVAALVRLERTDVEGWYPALAEHAGCLLDWFLVDLELARVATLLGRWDEAEAHFDRAADMCTAGRLRPFLGQVQHHWALMLLRRRAAGDRRRAQDLLREAVALFDSLGLRYLRDQADGLLAVPLRGRRVTWGTDGLTAREVAVLALLVEGKSNRDIARQLFVTEKTVEHHLANIYSKLGVAGRAAAVAHALREGLFDA